MLEIITGRPPALQMPDGHIDFYLIYIIFWIILLFFLGMEHKHGLKLPVVRFKT